jgi:hypothetical protein
MPISRMQILDFMKNFLAVQVKIELLWTSEHLHLETIKS